MSMLPVQLKEEGKMILGTTKVWSYCEEGTKDGYFLEFGKKVIYFYIALNDRYQDYALSARFIHPKDIIFKEKKFIGNYENCELFFKENEFEKTYTLLSNGSFIGEAYFDFSDWEHPKGRCNFSHAYDLAKLRKFMPREISFTFPKMKENNETKRVLIVYGKPGLGKKTTIHQFYKNFRKYGLALNTDNFRSPEDLFQNYRIGEHPIIIINKYDHVRCCTDKGIMSFKEALIHLLKLHGHETFQMEFLERFGNDLDHHALVVENNVFPQIELQNLFGCVSDKIQPDHLTFMKKFPRVKIDVPHIKARIYQ